MRRTEMLQEIRKMRFEEVYSEWSESRLSQEEAARILGVSDRTFRRYIDRYEHCGLDGLSDTIPAIGEGGMLGGGTIEFECRRAADRRASGAGNIAVQGDITGICPQMAGIVDPAFDDQPAAPDGLDQL